MKAPAHLLEWDSEFFACRVARGAGNRLTDESLARLLEWCNRETVDWLYFLADADDQATVQVAEQAGFHLVDIRVELGVALAQNRPTGPSESVRVRPAAASDLERLRPMAAAGHSDSRYFFDPRVPKERARHLYERWIERSVLEGFADVVLVADVDGVASGYITGRFDGGTTASIGLIGVDSEVRGLGMGTALVASLLSWAEARGAARVTVVTQGRNVTAQRLYQKCGFRTETVRLWYHRWFDR